MCNTERALLFRNGESQCTTVDLGFLRQPFQFLNPFFLLIYLESVPVIQILEFEQRYLSLEALLLQHIPLLEQVNHKALLLRQHLRLGKCLMVSYMRWREQRFFVFEHPLVVHQIFGIALDALVHHEPLQTPNRCACVFCGVESTVETCAICA